MIGWAIDIGVASQGFLIIERDKYGEPLRLVDGIAHIFPAATGGSERRVHRSMRVQNQRRSERLKELLELLCPLLSVAPQLANAEYEFPGLNGKQNSRVFLRAKGLEAKLEAEHLLMALYHLAKNRGQRLTRGLNDKDEAGNEKERAKEASSANSTRQQLKNLGKELGLPNKINATPGQLLWEREKDGQPTKLKKIIENCPVFVRQDLRNECHRLLEAQKNFHSCLQDPAVRLKIAEKVFFEENPKSPEVGKCLYGFLDDNGNVEVRLSRGTDLFQRKRIYEEINNLRFRDRQTASSYDLTLEQRNILAKLALEGTELTISQIKKNLFPGLGKTSPVINLQEQAGRKSRKTAGSIAPHPLAEALRKAGSLDLWLELSGAQREELADVIREQDDPEIAVDSLMNNFQFDDEATKRLLKVRLPAARSAAGKTATSKLLMELEKAVISTYEAEQNAGLKRSDYSPDQQLERLPYYGELFPDACVGGTGHPADKPEVRYGRIPNPVVHVALNRLRKLANTYVKRYGSPKWVNLELARDLNKSQEEREKIDKEIKNNREANDQRAKQIIELGGKVNRRNLNKLKLYYFQGQRCLYSGQELSLEDLFRNETEIDHILPWKETQDDSLGNLALVTKSANQFKGKRGPYEAFSNGFAGRTYGEILKQVDDSRKQILWRFEEGALEKYQKQSAMPARFLNDTRYIAKLAAGYLAHLTGSKDSVLPINGKMTAIMRRLWGVQDCVTELMVEEGRLDERFLPSKESGPDQDKDPQGFKVWQETRSAISQAKQKLRYDHRHHLLDAIIVGCITRSDVQRLQTLSAQMPGHWSTRDIADLIKSSKPFFQQAGLPWQKGFKEEVKAFLRKPDGKDVASPMTRVSHKADHNPLGQLHKETLYRIICENPKQPGQYLCGSHSDIVSLVKKKQIEDIGVTDGQISILRLALEAGQDVEWGRGKKGKGDPLLALEKNLKKEQENLRKALLDRLEQVAPEIKSEAKRCLEATTSFIRESKQQRFLKTEVKTLRKLRGKKSGNHNSPIAVPTGSNDRLVCWLDQRAEPQWSVVATIDAVNPRFEGPWKSADGQVLFELRKNDLVECLLDPKNTTSKRGLFRLAKLSPGDYEFLPLEEARSAAEGRNGPHAFTLRVTSNKMLDELQIRQVVLHPDGTLKWISRARN